MRSSTGTATSKHKFVGSLGHPSDDETGLIYMRARHYDPVTGRFISEDPAGHGGNWYAYCADDPVNKLDANGHDEAWADFALTEVISWGLNVNETLAGCGLYPGFLRHCTKLQACIWLSLAAGELTDYGLAYDATATELGADAQAAEQAGDIPGHDALTAAAGLAAGLSVEHMNAAHQAGILGWIILTWDD